MAATGVASTIVAAKECEDTITLSVKWENYSIQEEGKLVVTSVGHAVYTSSWIMPKCDVHTQQRVFYMGHKGEVCLLISLNGHSSHSPARCRLALIKHAEDTL